MEPGKFSAHGAFIVLGASGGIGAALTDRLRDRGARLVVAARNTAPLEDRFGRDASVVGCDVTEPATLDAVFDRADDLAGSTAGVALCVGSILLKPAHLTSDAEWAETIAKNLSAAFFVARTAGKRMKKGGSVVFCSTAAAATGLPNHDAIAAAKAGVEGLVRSAAATYAARGLRFHAVAPGLVCTPLSESVTSNPKALETSTRMHPLGRIGEPDDVASAIEWLLDPANDWTSGQVMRVDGGLAALRGRPAG